uniref:Uncharacterized protein n=1 Tax=Timema monikensis TaxID=170555 RepID=A0A7R9HLW5_9NEOP|nr:unnamed protein product [Timema monikensis]
MRILRRNIRDMSNPFEILEIAFQTLFCESRILARDLCGLLRGRLQRTMTSGIPVPIQIRDQDLRALNVNARFPGRVHAQFIWRDSAVKVEMKRLHQERIGDFYLLEFLSVKKQWLQSLMFLKQMKIMLPMVVGK